MASTQDDQSKPVKGSTPSQPTHPPFQPSYQGYPMVPNGYNQQPSYYHNGTYAASLNKSRSNTCCRGLIILTFMIFFIFAIFNLLVWLVLRPRIPEFRVESFVVSNFSIFNSALTGNWDIGLATINPNEKISIFYERMELGVLYGESFLSMSTLGPVYIGPMDEKYLQTKLTENSTPLYDDLSARNMDVDRRKGKMRFNVNIIARVKFKSGDWVTGRRYLRIYCEKLVVRFSNSTGVGFLRRGGEDCTVHY